MEIRKTLENLETELEQMKAKEVKLFRIKFESYKKGSTRQSIQYDLMYSALFGNHVVL